MYIPHQLAPGAMADQVCSSDKCGKSCGINDVDDQNKVEEGSNIVATKGAYCKCGEGWTCVITKTDDGAPHSGKIFFNCGEGCTCEIGSTTSSPAGTCTLSEAGVGGSDAFCKCGDGWTCVITRTESSKMGKAFAECGDGCCISTTAA